LLSDLSFAKTVAALLAGAGNLFAVNTKGAFLTMQAVARHVSDGGRIIYTGSSTMAYSTPGFALHGGSEVAPGYLVQVLAKEVANAMSPLTQFFQPRQRVQAFIPTFGPITNR